MRFQVPQFVDIEDKIIGPLTLKQFLMYVFATMLLVPVFLFSDLALFITIALPVFGVAAAFAHFKINGKTLFQTAINASSYYSGSPLYVWKRTDKTGIITIQDQHWDELITAREVAKEDLYTLARKSQALETAGNIVKSEDVPDDIAPNNE